MQALTIVGLADIPKTNPNHLAMEYSLRKFLFLLFFAFSLSLACEEDPCAGVNCTNGGTCIEETGTCDCLAGYEGDACETNTILKFVGSYAATYAGCFSTSPDHKVDIEQLDGENRLRMYDLGDYACPGARVVLEANISGDQITIPSQNIDCNGEIEYTFSGSGSISGNVITLDFVVSYDADGIARMDNCTATLEK